MKGYIGGKSRSGIYQTIINNIPIHYVYVEGFLGSGSIMRLKRPADIDIGIEKNSDVAGKYRCQLEKKVGEGLQLLNMDFMDWMKENIGGIRKDWFLYLDPPYLMSVRTSKRRYYQVEFSDERSHLAMLQAVKKLDCMVMISGYWSELYRCELENWRPVEIPTVNRAGKACIEVIWMNYLPGLPLHDLTYLGDGYREREKICRRVRRWMKKGYDELQIRSWLASKKRCERSLQLELL